MSLIKRYTPRKMRDDRKQEQPRVVETKSPTLGPVAKNITETVDISQEILEETQKPQTKIQEPVQINQSIIQEPEPIIATNTKNTFDLYDLNYFCEERLYGILFQPLDIQQQKIQKITREFYTKTLEVYAEYSQEVTIGAFKDRLYYYSGDVLIPEDYITISGFMRKFLNIDRVQVLYNTGEIILRSSEFCNFWLHRIQKFFEPINRPLDRPEIQDEELCLDCNLSCAVRHRQQMTK